MRAGLFLVALAAGCFAEAPSPVGNECPIGSKGCPCTGGGACDAPLECHAQSQACYDPECDEGSLNCPCFEGMCFGDLRCAEDLCQAPVEVSGSDSGGATSSTMDETRGITSDEEDTAAQTGPADTGAGDDGATEGGCMACFAAQIGTACLDENDVCGGGSGCIAMRQCVIAQSSSFATCCEQVEDGTTNWAVLAGCLTADVCLEACEGITTSCGG